MKGAVVDMAKIKVNKLIGETLFFIGFLWIAGIAGHSDLEVVGQAEMFSVKEYVEYILMSIPFFVLSYIFYNHSGSKDNKGYKG